MYIGGAFPRSESGRSFAIYRAKSKTVFAHVCQASRKDIRIAVEAAKNAAPDWAKRTAYNRGQILYRMAEMLETKRGELLETMQATLAYSNEEANATIEAAIDSLVYYAGFTDKIQQVSGGVNPVASPHHNFTNAEPTGVVGILARPGFASFVQQFAAAICSGNTVVVVLPEQESALIAPLAEALATSDLPAGVVNLVTGTCTELALPLVAHMEVNAIDIGGGAKEHWREWESAASENMKRIVKTPPALGLSSILSFVEYKTVWHPIGN